MFHYEVVADMKILCFHCFDPPFLILTTTDVSDSIKKGHFLKVHLSKSALSNLFYMKWTSDNFLQYVIIIRIRFGFCCQNVVKMNFCCQI